MNLTRALPMLFMLLATPAMAIDCPSVPDTADTRYLENAERRAVCLNNQLNGASRQLEFDTRLQMQGTAIQRLLLENRFDRLPRFGE